MIKYRFVVEELGREIVLKHDGMIVETNSEELAEEFLDCWKPCYKSIRIKKVEV